MENYTLALSDDDVQYLRYVAASKPSGRYGGIASVAVAFVASNPAPFTPVFGDWVTFSETTDRLRFAFVREGVAELVYPDGTVCGYECSVEDLRDASDDSEWNDDGTRKATA